MLIYAVYGYTHGLKMMDLTLTDVQKKHLYRHFPQVPQVRNSGQTLYRTEKL